MVKILSKLSNTKTLIALASSIILILTTVGVDVDNQSIMIVVKSICSIGVLLGVLNDKGMETLKFNDKEVK